ncbi:hypothetical protein Bca101_043986 [Brassica carinata]
MKTTKRKRQVTEDDFQNSQSNLHTHEIKTLIPLSSIFSRILHDVNKIENKSAPNKQQLHSDVLSDTRWDDDGFEGHSEQSYEVFSDASDTESDESCHRQETLDSSVSEKQKRHIKNMAEMMKMFFGDIGKPKPKTVAKETQPRTIQIESSKSADPLPSPPTTTTSTAAPSPSRSRRYPARNTSSPSPTSSTDSSRAKPIPDPRASPSSTPEPTCSINLCKRSITSRVRKLIYNNIADVVFGGSEPICDGDESLRRPLKFPSKLMDFKAQAEALIKFANNRDGLLTCDLRSSIVFGPGDMEFVPFLVNLAKSGYAKGIEKLGKCGETVKVAPGYFRNHIMPKLLAVPKIDKYAHLIREQRKMRNFVEKEEVKVVHKTSEVQIKEFEKAAKRLANANLVLRKLIIKEKFKNRSSKEDKPDVQTPVTKEDIVSEVARQLCVKI